MLVINIILLATALIIVFVEGFTWFAVWDMVPLLVTAVFSEYSLSAGDGEWRKTTFHQRARVFGLVSGVVLVTVYVHLEWFFGVSEAAGASGSGIRFIFWPLLAFIGGGIGYVIGHIVGSRTGPEEPMPERVSKPAQGPEDS